MVALEVEVLNPRTHIKDGKPQFTDYLVTLRTDSPEFALKESRVRRRTSDFSWLHLRLGQSDFMMVTLPELPRANWFRRFSSSSVELMQVGFQNYLNKLVEVKEFLLDPALHLFLQTQLVPSQMDYVLGDISHLSNVRDVVLRLDHKPCPPRRPLLVFRHGSLEQLPHCSTSLITPSRGGYISLLEDPFSGIIVGDSNTTVLGGSPVGGMGTRHGPERFCSSWNGQSGCWVDLLLESYVIVDEISQEDEKSTQTSRFSSMSSLSSNLSMTYVDLSELSHQSSSLDNNSFNQSHSYDNIP